MGLCRQREEHDDALRQVENRQGLRHRACRVVAAASRAVELACMMCMVDHFVVDKFNEEKKMAGCGILRISEESLSAGSGTVLYSA